MNYDIYITSIPDEKRRPLIARRLASDWHIHLDKATAILNKLPLPLAKNITTDKRKDIEKVYKGLGCELKSNPVLVPPPEEKAPSDPPPPEKPSSKDPANLEGKEPPISTTDRNRDWLKVKKSETHKKESDSHAVKNSEDEVVKNISPRPKVTPGVKKNTAAQNTRNVAIIFAAILALLFGINFFAKPKDFRTENTSMKKKGSFAPGGSEKTTQKDKSIPKTPSALNKEINNIKSLISEKTGEHTEALKERLSDLYLEKALKQDDNSAIKFFKFAISFNPQNKDAWYGLADAYFRAGRTENYRETLGKIESIFKEERSQRKIPGNLSAVLSRYPEISGFPSIHNNKITVKIASENEPEEMRTVYSLIKDIDNSRNFREISVILLNRNKVVSYSPQSGSFPSYPTWRKNADIKKRH
ncbi:MAG: tetratricopeptide repeat protein [Fibrobacterota bacterium]